MDLGEVDALRQRHDGPEQFIPADHHDLVDAGLLRGAARMRQSLLEAPHNDGAGRHETGIARQHDVEPVIEHAGKGLEGPAAHDDGLAKRNTDVYKVPDKHFFMMGDNRDNSTDSRFLSEVGYVPFENLVGRAQIIFFSIGEDASFWQVWKWPTDVRWSRLLQVVH